MKGQGNNLFSSRLRSKFLTAYDLAQRFGWRRFLGEIVPWLFVRRCVFCSKSICGLPPESPPEVPLRLELAAASLCPHKRLTWPFLLCYLKTAKDPHSLAGSRLV